MPKGVGCVRFFYFLHRQKQMIFKKCQMDILPIMRYTIFKSNGIKYNSGRREKNAISISCRNCKKMEYIGA